MAREGTWTPAHLDAASPQALPHDTLGTTCPPAPNAFVPHQNAMGIYIGCFVHAFFKVESAPMTLRSFIGKSGRGENGVHGDWGAGQFHQRQEPSFPNPGGMLNCCQIKCTCHRHLAGRTEVVFFPLLFFSPLFLIKILIKSVVHDTI